MQSNIKQNIFYKKQMQQRQLQLIGMLEAEQYIDMEEQPQNQQSSGDLDDPHWQSIKYTLRSPIKETPKQIQDCINYDLMRYYGKKAYFREGIVSEDADEKSQIMYTFELRSSHAVVDCFEYVVTNKGEYLEIIPLFQKTKLKDINQQIISQIKNINSRWQFQGVYIKTALRCGKEYKLMIELPNKLKGYLIWPQQKQIISLIDQIKYFFLHWFVKNIPIKQKHRLLGDIQIQIGHRIDLEELRQLNLHEKIILFYNLSLNAGLSLKINTDTNDLIDLEIAKTNNAMYSQITRHIAQLYSLQESECQQQELDSYNSLQKEQFHRMLIKLIQCQQEEQQKYLHNLYQLSLKILS